MNLNATIWNFKSLAIRNSHEWWPKRYENMGQNDAGICFNQIYSLQVIAISITNSIDIDLGRLT